MKTTKILASLAMTGLLSTGLYAACNGQGNMQKEMKNGNVDNCNMHKSHKMMKKSHKKIDHGPMTILRHLNLSPEQDQQIEVIKADIMKNRVTVDVAFTKEGFDKGKFIEIMKQKRENMLESKAEMINRVFKVLTPKQKEQFKVLMDLKKEKRMAMMKNMKNIKNMHKGMNFDKNCNGRR